MFSHQLSYLARRSRRSLWFTTLLALLFIWLLDYVSGPQVSIAIFYLLPVGLATWYLSRRAGLVIAFGSAAAWLVADLVTNPLSVNPFILFWNASVRLGIFLIVTFVLASLREARLRQEELIAFVVHDLQSPLGNILGSVEMIDMIAEEGSEISEFIELILVSGKGMLLLIDSLLDLARLESGKMPVRRESVTVEPLLAEAIQHVSALALQRQVRVTANVGPDVHSVTADRDLLGRILVNLLSNALKFSPAGSTIGVEARLTANQSLTICVADEGPGIPEKWHRQVFDKFEQVHARKEGAAIGSGLGLTFSRMAIEAQGGHIWLEPDRESGTVICLTIPLGA